MTPGDMVRLGETTQIFMRRMDVKAGQSCFQHQGWEGEVACQQEVARLTSWG